MSEIEVNNPSREKCLDKNPKDFTLRKLSYRMRTEREIRSLMAKEGFSDEIIFDTISELKSYGYIDDRKFCEEYFRVNSAKGKASFRIIKELSEKGIDRSYASSVIEEFRVSDEYDGERDEFKLAFGVAEKIYQNYLGEGKIPDSRLYARIGRRLLSLGYGSSTCYSVIGRLMDRNKE